MKKNIFLKNSRLNMLKPNRLIYTLLFGCIFISQSFAVVNGVEIWSTGIPDILSTNKPVSASSSYENWGWYKANLTDGNSVTNGTSNGWSSQLGLTTNHTEWASIDLGAVFFEVTEVDLYPRNDSGNIGEGFPIDFTIEVSTDNSTWTTVVTEIGHLKPGNVPQKFMFASTEARYIRLVATNLRQVGSDYVLQLAEMEVIGFSNPPLTTLSTNKSVTASSSVENWGWFKANLTDGNPDTDGTSNGWSSQLGNASNHTEWTSIDLGTVNSVTQVDLYPRNDSGNIGEGFPVDFTIQVSTDNSTWTTVRTETNHVKPGNAPQIFIFESIKARYIKLEITNLRPVGNDYMAQLAEMSVIGFNTPLMTLSTYKAVTPSSTVENWGWSASNLTDSNPATDGTSNGWSSQLGIASNHTEWVSIDLGAVNLVKQVDLYPRNDIGNVGEGFPVDFTIQVSTDNSTWVTVVTQTGHAKPSNVPQKFTIAEIDARYVKLVATNLRPLGNDYMIQLAEISVLGVTLPGPASNFVIVTDLTADAVDIFASTELQSYLSKITGSSKPSVTTSLTSGKTNIVIGASTESLPASILSNLGVTITETSHGYDGYIIRNTTYNGNDVVLLTGYKTRAVLFAAYKLLEHLGCRFHGQKSISFEEVIPNNPSLTIAGLNISETPNIKYRMLNNNDFYAQDAAQLEKVADWGAKNGFNSIQLGLRFLNEVYDTSILQKRGLEIHLGTHNWDQFISNSGTTWFTNEANITTFLNNVKTYANNHPEAVSIGAWQPDGDRGAIRITGKDGTIWRFAEWNLYITNRIAQMFRANGINKRVMWIAYSRGNVVPKTGSSYLVPDSLLDLLYFNQMQDYSISLSTGDNPVPWIINDSRRFENTDYTTDPVPNSLLSAKQRAIDWNNYCNSQNFTGNRIWVDHINYNIGRWLSYPLLSYTQMGPWINAENDLIYLKSLNYDGWTNTYEFPYINYNAPKHSPSPYWFRRISEALWNPSASRPALDTDFYEKYYGTASTYALQIQNYFNTIYNDIVTKPANSATSVTNVQGAYFTTITNIYNAMNTDSNVTQDQKDRVYEIYLWHRDKYIPRKVEYKNKGNLFNYTGL